MTTVGVVGLGALGEPMARRLVSTGGPVLTHDVDPSRTVPGAEPVGSLAELGERCDVVCVVVLDDEQVRAVAGALDGSGAVVLVHSTVAPDTPASLPGRVLDAPVSGGVGAAADGTLAVMVGGDATLVEAARPVLERLGGLVLHVGDLGAGTRLKLARNLLTYVAMAAREEAARLVDGSDHLAAVVAHTEALVHSGPPLDPAHLAALARKDLGLAVGLADELGADVPVARAALDRLS